MKKNIKKLEARIATLEARVLDDVRGDWWVKVHGLNHSRSPHVLTIVTPLAISDIATVEGFSEFTEITHVEYKYEQFRAIKRDYYPPMDSLYRKHPGPKKFTHLSKFKSAKELRVGDSDIPIMTVIDGFSDLDPDEFKAMVQAPKFMWDDPEMGKIFQQIDELKESDAQEVTAVETPPQGG